jgi:predicted RNase H-like HicB family nuclease
MNSIQHYLIVIEKALHNYGAFSPDVLGCAATATTIEEALELMKEGLQFHLEALVEDGDEIPLPRPVTEHIEYYRAQGADLCGADFILAFIPVQEVLPEPLHTS